MDRSFPNVLLDTPTNLGPKRVSTIRCHDEVEKLMVTHLGKIPKILY